MNNNLQKGGFFFGKDYCDRFDDETKSGSASTSGGNLHGEQLDKLNTMAKQLRILLNIATADKGKEEEVRQAMKEGYDKFIQNEDQMVKDMTEADEIEKNADAGFADAKKRYGKSFFQRIKNSSAIKRAREARTNLINEARKKREGLKEKLQDRAEGLDDAAFRRFRKPSPAEETSQAEGTSQEQVPAGMYPSPEIIAADDSQGVEQNVRQYGPLEYERNSVPQTNQVVEKPKTRGRFLSYLRYRLGRSRSDTNMVRPDTNMVVAGGTIKKNKKNKRQKITRKKIKKKYKKSGNTNRQKSKKFGNTKRQKSKKSGNTKRQKSKKYRKNH